MTDMPWLRPIQGIVRGNPHAAHLWEQGGERVCCEAFCRLLENPAKIMDIGAGYGYASRLLHERHPNARVISVDYQSYASPDEEMYPAPLEVYDAHSIGRVGGCFDAVWAAHILEHLQSPLDALWEWRRLLGPTQSLMGVVVPSSGSVDAGHLWDFSDPNRLSYIIRL